MWEIVAHATNKLLVIGKDESGCCATQGREALVYFEVAMCWNELRRTGGVRSFVVQEEVVCMADELFAKEGVRYCSLAGGAGGLGVVVVCRDLRRTSGVGLCRQRRGPCVDSSYLGFVNATCSSMFLLESSWLRNDVATSDAGEVL